jgi:hypothetical protein
VRQCPHHNGFRVVKAYWNYRQARTGGDAGMMQAAQSFDSVAGDDQFTGRTWANNVYVSSVRTRLASVESALAASQCRS